MAGNLVVKIAVRRRTELGNLYAAAHTARRLALESG
jgi:hypothetical protein